MKGKYAQSGIPKANSEARAPLYRAGIRVKAWKHGRHGY